MLGLAIPWLVIIACFLVGAIVNVIEGEKLVNFKDYSIEEQEEFVSNAIAIYRNNNLGSSAITTQVARFFLFLVDPRMEVTA